MTTSCSEKAAELLHRSQRNNYCALQWSKEKSSYGARSGAPTTTGGDRWPECGAEQQENILIHKCDKCETQVLPKRKCLQREGL